MHKVVKFMNQKKIGTTLSHLVRTKLKGKKFEIGKIVNPIFLNFLYEAAEI